MRFTTWRTPYDECMWGIKNLELKLYWILCKLKCAIFYFFDQTKHNYRNELAVNMDGFPLEPGSSLGFILLRSQRVFPCCCQHRLAHKGYGYIMDMDKFTSSWTYSQNPYPSVKLLALRQCSSINALYRWNWIELSRSIRPHFVNLWSYEEQIFLC